MNEDEQIECCNCGVTPEDVGISSNRVAPPWYCSQECYDEKTIDE